MAADAEIYGDARDEQAKHVVRLAEVVVRGASDLVRNLLRTSVELSEHDAVPFLSAAGCIVRLVIQHAEAVGENDEYVREAGQRALAVQSVVDSLEQAEFPTGSPALDLKSIHQKCALLPQRPIPHPFRTDWG